MTVPTLAFAPWWSMTVPPVIVAVRGFSGEFIDAMPNIDSIA